MNHQPVVHGLPAEEATGAPDATSQSAFGIGPYRLLQRVGEGGMGDVWLAEQTSPVRRQVALKLIKAGMDTAHVIARFEAERQALAVMDHPAIAKVFDAGATPQGRSFFVMEYVRGEPITTYCNRQRLSTRDRLDLFLQVCDGVQHAHQKGIIHRDLKPSNILVTLLDGNPVPKIIDFGVAKAIAQPLTDRPLYTELGALIGTLEYMSPEQAEMSGLDIDTRTDVYALGVILYELLTGVLPFDAQRLREQGLDEIRRTIREVEPARPSVRVTTSTQAAQSQRPSAFGLARELRGDLDWITMRALDKDRTRRYGSAAELAADVRRHLDHLPVVAGPPSTAYRMRKFGRRHRVGVTVAATLVALLLAFATTTALQAQRIARERDRANQEAAIAEAVNDFLQNDLLAQASAGTQARPDTKPDPDLKVRTALDRAAARIEGKFAAQPLVEASIRQTIGTTYIDLGLYPEAQGQLQRALDLRRRALGETHPDTLEVMSRLGDAYTYQGKYADAESVLSNALEIGRRVLGEEHPKTMAIMNNLGLAYERDGKYSQAEPLYARTLELRRRVSGGEHPETLIVANGLAALYYRQGKYGQAEPIFNEVLQVRRQVLGDDHPSTFISMNNLAMTYRAEGKYAQAEPLFLRTLEASRRVMGEQHPDTLRRMNNLGLLYSDQGKYAAAEPLLLQALEARRKVVGEEHPDTLATLDNLASLYGRQRKYVQAEALFAKVIDARRRTLGEGHPDTAATENELATLYADWGKPDEAAAWQRTLRPAR